MLPRWKISRLSREQKNSKPLLVSLFRRGPFCLNSRKGMGERWKKALGGWREGNLEYVVDAGKEEARKDLRPFRSFHRAPRSPIFLFSFLPSPPPPPRFLAVPPHGSLCWGDTFLLNIAYFASLSMKILPWTFLLTRFHRVQWVYVRLFFQLKNFIYHRFVPSTT